MAAIEASLITGATIGISIAAPFGPSSMLCIQRTMGGGFYAGLATGLGVATVHLTYGTAASLSSGKIAEILHGSMLFPLISSIVLMVFAVRALRNVVVFQPAGERSDSLALNYVGAVMFGFFNPLTPLLFAALSPSLTAGGPGASGWIVTGVFLGSLIWWAVLTTGVSYFRDSITPRLMNASNKIAGLLLAVMAVSIIVRRYYGAA